VTESELLLVVDDDVDIARFIEVNLRLQGYEVLLAYDGEKALELIESRQPALAIVDWMMPRIDGLELTRRVRSNPFTASMPIILLTARGMTADKVVGLTAGSDDYLVKPFDTLELVARVRSTLRRTQEYREVSPLTGLPGNNRILLEIAERARSGAEYAVCYMDIDRFKSVNDAYGFARGDEFIAALARSLHRAVTTVDGPPAFIGHVGGDDFVVVCAPEQVRALTEKTVVDFEQSADALYDPKDAARGHIVLKSRRGEPQQANLVTLSIGVAFSAAREWTDPREIVAVSSDMKTVAKKFPGSYVAFDRRGAGGHYGLAPDSHLGLAPGGYVGPASLAGPGGAPGAAGPPGSGSGWAPLPLNATPPHGTPLGALPQRPVPPHAAPEGAEAGQGHGPPTPPDGVTPLVPPARRPAESVTNIARDSLPGVSDSRQ
jgi:diguanylate cyclase (GGDEF)-like protein